MPWGRGMQIEQVPVTLLVLEATLLALAAVRKVVTAKLTRME